MGCSRSRRDTRVPEVGAAQYRRNPVQLEDPADCRGADAVAELEQLTLDALVAPDRILSGHLLGQVGDDIVDG